MQQCFMFIDTGNGWTPVNDSAKDIAALRFVEPYVRELCDM